MWTKIKWVHKNPHTHTNEHSSHLKISFQHKKHKHTHTYTYWLLDARAFKHLPSRFFAVIAHSVHSFVCIFRFFLLLMRFFFCQPCYCLVTRICHFKHSPVAGYMHNIYILKTVEVAVAVSETSRMRCWQWQWQCCKSL